MKWLIVGVMVIAVAVVAWRLMDSPFAGLAAAAVTGGSDGRVCWPDRRESETEGTRCTTG